MIDTRLPCRCHDTKGEICPKCRGYSSIVNRPPDDGKGRKSAYDTTWPDMHNRDPKGQVNG